MSSSRRAKRRAAAARVWLISGEERQGRGRRRSSAGEWNLGGGVKHSTTVNFTTVLLWALLLYYFSSRRLTNISPQPTQPVNAARCSNVIPWSSACVAAILVLSNLSLTLWRTVACGGVRLRAGEEVRRVRKQGDGISFYPTDHAAPAASRTATPPPPTTTPPPHHPTTLPTHRRVRSVGMVAASPTSRMVRTHSAHSSCADGPRLMAKLGVREMPANVTDQSHHTFPPL